VEHERVAVRVDERRHVADARVDGLADELDALRLELGPCGPDVVHLEERDGVRLRLELLAPLLRHPDREARVAGPELALRVLVRTQPERLDVDPPRPLPVSRRNADGVDLRDEAHPTEPSIWSWISRFISTAYSSGSSFV